MCDDDDADLEHYLKVMRDEIIEECALVADKWEGIDSVAAQIRRLKTKDAANVR